MQKANRPRDARLGHGQYFTDIPPKTMTHQQLSQILYRNQGQVNQVQYYFAIDVTNLVIVHDPERPHVYAHLRNTDLVVRGRIVRHGKN
jgi:hypothetical protein